MEIAERAEVTLVQHRQLQPTSAEAGGVLLGRLLEGSADVVVDEASTPAPTDRRSRYNFYRERNTAQQRVNTAWAESAGTRVYLGEWHSHPEDVPQPSGYDLRDWQRIVREATYEQDALFFVITGRVEIRVWEFSKQSRNAMMLHRDEDQA